MKEMPAPLSRCLWAGGHLLGHGLRTPPGEFTIVFFFLLHARLSVPQRHGSTQRSHHLMADMIVATLESGRPLVAHEKRTKTQPAVTAWRS